MSRPLLVDLFCCAGGASLGYHDAGFDVVGVDIEPQPHYPFEFVQADVINEADRISGLIDRADALAASPPCQAHSQATRVSGNPGSHVDLIPQTRELLEASGKPYVIENVIGAPLRDPVMLCGLMFPGLRVFRHRLFETNWDLPQPEHPSHKGTLCYTLDKRKPHYGQLSEWEAFVTVTGGGNCSKAAGLDAMGLPPTWPGYKQGLNQMIPPAYTNYIGKHLMAEIS